jgi:hypothetical protein
LDSNWRGTLIDQSQFGHQGKCATCESECFIWTNCHIIVNWTSKGVQIYIFSWTYKDLNGIPLEIV